jgi:hypothetical protein
MNKMLWSKFKKTNDQEQLAPLIPFWSVITAWMIWTR